MVTWLVLSPHLDDAVLSAGALLGAFAPDVRLVVATAFTTAGEGPWSRSARRFTRFCRADDPEDLFVRRRAEDRAVLSGLGAEPVHLGFVDALFRRHALLPGVPGVSDVSVPTYPTFRLHVVRGRPAGGDRELIGRLGARVRGLVRRLEPSLVLAPLGIGKHVDHVLVRDCARSLVREHGQAVLYYSDFPYSLGSRPSGRFVAENELAEFRWITGRLAVRSLVEGYRSQFPALFPDGVMPFSPERFWVNTRRGVPDMLRRQFSAL